MFNTKGGGNQQLFKQWKKTSPFFGVGIRNSITSIIPCFYFAKLNQSKSFWAISIFSKLSTWQNTIACLCKTLVLELLNVSLCKYCHCQLAVYSTNWALEIFKQAFLVNKVPATKPALPSHCLERSSWETGNSSAAATTPKIFLHRLSCKGNPCVQKAFIPPLQTLTMITTRKSKDECSTGFKQSSSVYTSF